MREYTLSEILRDTAKSLEGADLDSSFSADETYALLTGLRMVIVKHNDERKSDLSGFNQYSIENLHSHLRTALEEHYVKIGNWFDSSRKCYISTWGPFKHGINLDELYFVLYEDPKNDPLPATMRPIDCDVESYIYALETFNWGDNSEAINVHNFAKGEKPSYKDWMVIDTSIGKAIVLKASSFITIDKSAQIISNGKLLEIEVAIKNYLKKNPDLIHSFIDYLSEFQEQNNFEGIKMYQLIGSENK